MLKHEKAPKTRLITATITEAIDEMAKDIISAGHALSLSEVVRISIANYHRKLFPKYAMAREERLKEEERIAAMTAEEYINEFFADYYHKIEDGKLVVFKPGKGKQVRIDLSRVKDINPDSDPEYAFARIADDDEDED